jgi:hypothetical protein
MPVQVQFLGYILDGAGATAPADMPGKALRVEGIVGKEAIAKSCQFPKHRQSPETPCQQASRTISWPFLPTLFHEDP